MQVFLAGQEVIGQCLTMNIEPANTTPRGGLVPNPKLRLREQKGVSPEY